MNLNGSLETMSVPELLQWLADANKTGTLTISYQSEKKEIYFKDGMIISASSNLDKDRFGVLVVKEGLITQENLMNLLEEGKATKKLLGRLFVEKGILTEEQTRKMLQHQAEQIIESLFHRQEGEFVFTEGNLPAKDLVQISLIMHQLFFDSSVKRNEWRRIQSILGRLDSVLKPVPNPPESISSLSEFELSLVTLCNGKNSISDICAKVHKSDFEICQTLTKLTEKRWLIRSDEHEEPGSEELNEAVWHASILLEQKRYLKAVRTLETMIKKYPGRSDLDSLVKKAQALLETDIRTTFPTDEIKPAVNPEFDSKKLQTLNLTPQDWFVYSRVNGQTTLRDLYRMTGLGKEASLRTLYSLIKSGAVMIRSEVTRKTGKFSAVKQPLKTTDTQTLKSLRSTGEFKIPEKYLEKKTDEEKEKQVEKTQEVPDIKELDVIYNRYINQSYYDMFGVSSLASVAKIREAFVTLSRKYHPDMYFQKLQSNVQERLEELFSIVNQGYRVLSNPAARKRYDEEIWANERFRKNDLDGLSSLINLTNEMKAEKAKVKPPLKPQPKPSDTSPLTTPKTQPIPGEQKSETDSQDEGIKILEHNLESPDAAKKSKWEQLFEEAKELTTAKKYKQAIDVLENAVKFNAKNPDLYYYLSRCYLKVDKPNFNKAEENIKKALILKPENPDFFCQLARVCLDKGDSTMAERYAKTALAWDPEKKEAKKILVELKEKSKSSLFDFKFFKKK